MNAGAGHTPGFWDPREAVLPGENEKIYENIQPLIERMAYYYPGTGSLMEQAFDRPWTLVSRDADDLFSVHSTWLKTATVDDLRTLFVQRSARQLARGLLRSNELFGTYSTRANPEKLQAVEKALAIPFAQLILHPVSLKEMQPKIDHVLDQARRTLITDVILLPPLHLATREEIYQDLASFKARQVASQICGNVASGGRVPASAIPADQIAKKVKDLQRDQYKYFQSGLSLKKYTLEGEAKILDPATRGLMEFFHQLRSSSAPNNFFFACKNDVKGKTAILDQYEKDEGQVRDPLTAPRPDSTHTFEAYYEQRTSPSRGLASESEE